MHFDKDSRIIALTLAPVVVGVLLVYMYMSTGSLPFDPSSLGRLSVPSGHVSGSNPLPVGIQLLIVESGGNGWVVAGVLILGLLAALVVVSVVLSSVVHALRSLNGGKRPHNGSSAV